MPRQKKITRYNVISFRVTDEEMKELKLLRKRRKTSYSRIMREALTRADCPFGGKLLTGQTFISDPG